MNEKAIKFKNELSQFKLFNHKEKLHQLIETGDCYPITIEIDLTKYCNHNCICCPDPFHDKTQLDRNILTPLLDELKDVGTKAIVIKGGGESIIHSEYEDIISEIKNKGFDLGTITNGSRLTEDSISKVLAEKADYVRISFNGPTRKTYKEMHRVDAFDNILDGIRKLVKYRKGRYPNIGISFPFDIKTIPYVDEAIALVDELDVDYILIRPFFYEEVGYERQMSADEAAQVRKGLLEATANYRGEKFISVGQFVSDYEHEFQAEKNLSLQQNGRREMAITRFNGIEHEIKKCYAHPMITALTADGKLWGCGNLRNYDEYCYGQIDYSKGQTFKKIWNGEQRKTARKIIDNAGCLQWCTHALGRYNEIIYYMKDCEKYFGNFL